MMEQTLAIIKPDTVTEKHTGKIIDIIEQAGFTIDRSGKRLIKKRTCRTILQCSQR